MSKNDLEVQVSRDEGRTLINVEISTERAPVDVLSKFGAVFGADAIHH